MDKFYIAQDRDKTVHFFSGEAPEKNRKRGTWKENIETTDNIIIDTNIFNRYISWEDENPTEVKIQIIK